MSPNPSPHGRPQAPRRRRWFIVIRAAPSPGPRGWHRAPWQQQFPIAVRAASLCHANSPRPHADIKNVRDGTMQYVHHIQIVRYE